MRNTATTRMLAGVVAIFSLTFSSTLVRGGPTFGKAVGHPTFMSPQANPIASNAGLVFVANTPADTLDVIDRSSAEVVARIHVGVDPVGVAVRPDGKEVWVTNHVSDSVSVIDTDPTSGTYLQVVDTVQDFDPQTRATSFDEPVGVAFASNEKAYVALSSENQIAVIDVEKRQVSKRLVIPAQDPRAIAVRGGRLYVSPFESGNGTQLSGCTGRIDGDLCTFDGIKHVVQNNNVLSLGYEADIVKHPDVPDRDLFVFDTGTDELIEVVDTVGTLLYGLAVNSNGLVFVAETDARNDSNGRAGTRGDGLAELENRAFLNRLARVDCSGPSCSAPELIDLEPIPPNHPEPGMAFATPFAIRISADDSTLVVSSAGSNKLFTVDPSTGDVLGQVTVGAIPRGIALESDESGKPLHAWVLNTGDDTVSSVALSDPASPEVVATIPLDDPTHPTVKRGRIAFNDASMSTTGTFSCESCHPDGNTDQLLWVLETPICSVPGCTQIMPRNTMPIRGLRDTAPYHWDGIPGDPYGGINTANIWGWDPPNCSGDEPETCTRFLVDGSLATTMKAVDDPTVNDEGKPGKLSAAERDDIAEFLLSVPYPPSQRRAYTNVLSSRAAAGFRLFHIDGDLQGAPSPNVCGDCHRMPYLVSTNNPDTGMDAPTWRGAYDRWLILPQGRVNIISFTFYGWIARKGNPERDVWRITWGRRFRFDPVWNMALEGSTGFSGSFARNVTLNKESARTSRTEDLLDALERSASENAIVLQGEGVFIDKTTSTPASLEFHEGAYVSRADGLESFTRDELVKLAAEGRFVGTFTGRLGVNVDLDHPQPAIWSLGPIQRQRGHQEFPVVTGAEPSMTISARHVMEGAYIIVDGRRVSGTISLESATHEEAAAIDQYVTVRLNRVPSKGMHFLQLQNPEGLFSNDFIFHSDPPIRRRPVRR